jgi:N-dimethylarginine dimethylaminohydrolase
MLRRLSAFILSLSLLTGIVPPAEVFAAPLPMGSSSPVWHHQALAAAALWGTRSSVSPAYSNRRTAFMLIGVAAADYLFLRYPAVRPILVVLGILTPLQVAPGSFQAEGTSLGDDVRMWGSRLIGWGVRLFSWTDPGRDFYMVSPNNFRLLAELNSWMDMENQPDAREAVRQWRALRNILYRIGARVPTDRADVTVPDQVFTANAGLAYMKDGVKYFIPSRFHHPERQGEEPLNEAAFQRRGYHVVDGLLKTGEYWEGEGDMLENDGVLYGGWGFRSAPTAHEKVAAYVGLPVVNLRLVNGHFYHLDTALAFLDKNTAIAYLPAFDKESQGALRERFRAPGKHLIELGQEDAGLFAGNAIVFGRKVVMNTVSDELAGRLSQLGFTVYRTPLSQFKKSGGAAKCLVLNVPAFRIFSFPRREPFRRRRAAIWMSAAA